MALKQQGAAAQGVDAAMTDLKTTLKSVTVTADHCNDLFSKASVGSRSDILNQEEKLAGEALQKVVDSIINTANSLNHYLELQVNAVEQLELSVDSLTTRARLARDVTGTDALKTFRVEQQEKRFMKSRRLADSEIPAGSKDLPVYRRGKIDLTALDRVGGSDGAAAIVPKPQLGVPMDADSAPAEAL